jgi:hypothetical protein
MKQMLISVKQHLAQQKGWCVSVLALVLIVDNSRSTGRKTANGFSTSGTFERALNASGAHDNVNNNKQAAPSSPVIATKQQRPPSPPPPDAKLTPPAEPPERASPQTTKSAAARPEAGDHKSRANPKRMTLPLMGLNLQLADDDKDDDDAAPTPPDSPTAPSVASALRTGSSTPSFSGSQEMPKASEQQINEKVACVGVNQRHR